MGIVCFCVRTVCIHDWLSHTSHAQYSRDISVIPYGCIIHYTFSSFTSLVFIWNLSTFPQQYNVSATTNHAQYTRDSSFIPYCCITCYTSGCLGYIVLLVNSLLPRLLSETGNSVTWVWSLVPLKAGVIVLCPHFIHKGLYLLHSFGWWRSSRTARSNTCGNDFSATA